MTRRWARAPSPARVAALVLALGVVARAAEAQTVDATVQLTDVSIQRHDAAVTVEIKTSGTPKYRSQLMDGPSRLVLDFADALYRWKAAPLAAGGDPVREIRGSQLYKGVARLVIELTRKAPYTIEAHAGGVRIVFGAAKTAAAPPAPAKPSVAAPAFKLQGTVLRDDGAVAYIADTATNQVKRYSVGDPIGDGVVETIEERHVVLKTPRGPVEFRMEEPNPGPRPQQ